MALFLLLPPLISAFSSVVAMFNTNYSYNLCMNVVVGIRPLLADNAALILLFVSLAALIAFIPLSLFAAKGKLWCFLVGAGLYAADMVYGFFLYDPNEATRFWMSIALHAVFLIAYAIGVVFYVNADKLLKANPKEIMGK
ncbi:MAG: hypothetical protein E7182_03000 [Erysipelotrichaceae bacterium]|nr:hypothetical protein [Erysipelotrichaceae bacterium]